MKNVELICFGCGKSLETGDKIKFMTFIFYDLKGKPVRRMLDDDCNEKLTEFIELLHKRQTYNDI